MAEDEMEEKEPLYCLGDIVHNDMEVKRLTEKGLVVIDREKLQELSNCKVLIRAHGEPPETYRLAIENNIELIDASCPVVLKLQHRVKNAFDKMERENGQIVIYGKKGHAEVIGLTGQTLEKAIVVMGDADLEKIDYTRPITLFSQTTKSTKGFYALSEKLKKKSNLPKGYWPRLISIPMIQSAGKYPIGSHSSSAFLKKTRSSFLFQERKVPMAWPCIRFVFLKTREAISLKVKKKLNFLGFNRLKR